jgi:hypothetical protein
MSDSGEKERSLKRKKGDEPDCEEELVAKPKTELAKKWYDTNVYDLYKWSLRVGPLPFQNKMSIIMQSTILSVEEVCTTKVCPIGYSARRDPFNFITHLAEGENELSTDEFRKVMLYAQYARHERGYFLEIGLSWLVVLKDYQVTKGGMLFTKRAEWKLSDDTPAILETGQKIWEILNVRAKEPMHVVLAATAMSSRIVKEEESWVKAFNGVTLDNLVDILLPIKDASFGATATLVDVLTLCSFADIDHAKLADILKDRGISQSKAIMKISALAAPRSPDKSQSLHIAKNGVKLDMAKVSELPDDCFVPLSNVRFTHTSVEALAGPNYRVFHTSQQLAKLYNQVGARQFQEISNVTYVSGAVLKALANKIKPLPVEHAAQGEANQQGGAASEQHSEWGE